MLFVLAIPALNDFDENKINTGRYAVKFIDRNGTEIGQRGILHNDAIDFQDIPDHLIKATLATEDRRFFEHFGVDVFGTARALFENARANDVVQGGSTITQQLAKNLFLSFERSLARKIKEAFLALLLEARFTKFQILKMYLDRAYLGGGAFGVEAASQFYFGKSVREINLSEAALLAGLFKAPTRFAPHVNLPASLARTNDVLTNLVEAGYMSPGQVHAARLNPARVVEPRQSQSPDWFLDWAFEEVQRVAEGRGHYVLTARVTVDMEMQRAAQEAMVTTLRSTQTRRGAPFSGALVAMDPDGAVRAVVGGIDYGESQFNRATHARRQPGSSFKIYVYATALENGFNPQIDRARRLGELRQLVAQELQRQRRLGPLADRNRRVQELAQHHGRRPLLQGGPREGAGDDAPARRQRRQTNVLDGARRYRHNAARAHRRLCRIRQWRQAGPPLRSPRALQFQGRAHLLARARRAPAPQIVSARVVEQMNQMMQAVVNEGTGRRAILDFTHAVGQDRHQLRLARRLVRGLHRRARHRRLGRA